MDLYFLRHGDAVPEGERPLSERGERDVTHVVDCLKSTGLAPDLILTSPLLRARQTAEIASRILGREPEVTDLLDCGATLGDLARLLADACPHRSVLLIGHEPDFSTMVGELTGGANVEMKKAAVARVECSDIAPAHGLLKWLVTPKLLGA